MTTSSQTDTTATVTDGLPQHSVAYREIRKIQEKIKRSEGSIAGCLVRIGSYLGELKATSPRHWGKLLQELNYSPRVASRHMKLGTQWGEEIGLIESDFGEKLPVDLLQLEWLCGIPVDQLGEFLKKHDCRKLGRNGVIVAVKTWLGQPVVTSQRPVNAETIMTRWEAQHKRMLADAQRLREQGLDDGQLKQLRAAVQQTAQQILSVLEPAA